jgi:hypothetical protein
MRGKHESSPLCRQSRAMLAQSSNSSTASIRGARPQAYGRAARRVLDASPNVERSKCVTGGAGALSS